MKKASSNPRAASREPSAASLREMPELELSRYRVRRNPYAARIMREGIRLAHDGPSAASLAALPEAEFTGRVRRNPYASRAAEVALQYGRGRPRRGQEVGATSTRSLRLPEKMWTAIDAAAEARSTTPHALVREVVVAFVARLARGKS